MILVILGYGKQIFIKGDSGGPWPFISLNIPVKKIKKLTTIIFLNNKWWLKSGNNKIVYKKFATNKLSGSNGTEIF